MKKKQKKSISTVRFRAFHIAYFVRYVFRRIVKRSGHVEHWRY